MPAEPLRSNPITLAPHGVVAVVGRYPTGPVGVRVAITSAEDAAAFGVTARGPDGPTLGEALGALPRDAGAAAIALTTLLAAGARPCVAVRTTGAGDEVTVEELLGDAAAGTGLHALDPSGVVDLICLPDAAHLSVDDASRLYTAAAAWCTEHGALLLVDAPIAIGSARELVVWADRPGLRSRDAALYVPRPLVDTPTGSRTIPASGAVAAVIARTDRVHGVWKAPAGTEAALVGVDGLETAFVRGDLEALNHAGIGVLRDLPGAGLIVWGARTLAGGGPQPDPQWRYVPVRRLAALVERSLRRGSTWVAGAPNDAATWHEVCVRVTRFLDELWRRGALQGSRPEQAYLVRCGLGITMTDRDVAAGVLVVEVGLAATRPAEFLMLRTQLTTAPSGDAPTEDGPATADGPATDDTRVVVEGSPRAARFRAERAVADGHGRDVLRIDLDAVTSTYIGETEKNLSLVIDLAEDVDAVLLFDEADALFGRRTEVADAHDRYADLEVASVRDRLERYPGTVVLGSRDATLLAPHLDLRPSRPPPA